MLPDGAEVVLEMVREQFGGTKLDHRRDAFERMKVAKQLVDGSPFGARLADGRFEREQGTACAGEVFFTLGETVVEEAAEAGVDCVAHRLSLRHADARAISARVGARQELRGERFRPLHINAAAESARGHEFRTRRRGKLGQRE